jgi:hypothetical protein
VSAIPPGIEDADGDIRPSSKRQKPLIAGDRLTVVDQDSHPHAAPRRAHQSIGDQHSRLVVMEDVILQVERLSRPLYELQTQQQPVHTDRKYPKP